MGTRPAAPSVARRLLAIGVVALFAATACGGSDSSDTTTTTSGGAATAPLTITSPQNGATVSMPLTVQFTSSEQIGPESSGKDHVHYIVDGKADEYVVITSTNFQIKNLAPGQHKIALTLQHADHSPVGPNAQIDVTVAGAAGSATTSGSTPSPTPSPSTSSDSGGDSGGGYGY